MTRLLDLRGKLHIFIIDKQFTQIWQIAIYDGLGMNALWAITRVPEGLSNLLEIKLS